MNKNLESLFDVLDSSAHMLINENLKYSSYANFFLGIEYGFSYSKSDEFEEFNDWLEKKEGRVFAASWSAYILQLNNNNEEKSIAMLITLFKQYVQELFDKGVLL